MERTDKRKGILIIVVLLVFAVSLIFCFGLLEKTILTANEPDEPMYSDSGDSRVFYENRWYSPKMDLESLLILGIDSIVLPDGTQSDSAQADFIALLVMDKRNKEFRILHINRDTMTDIEQLDDDGTTYGVFNAQIALAHTYGTPGKMQCRNTVAAVENLLYGIRVDHYFSMTMDAVAILNDSVGGVPVTLEEDFPALGESFVKGTAVTLRGDQALTFVRWRNDDAEQSNLGRMERQRQYINALFTRYTETDPGEPLDTMREVSEYTVSSCTVNQLSLILERLQEYTYMGTVTLAGEATKEAEYVEYHIDEAAAQKTVLDLFYELEE